MDLGIEGKSALVCGSSRGLGRACAEALLAAGVRVVLNGGDADQLEVTAKEIGDGIRSVAADVTTSLGRAAVLATCPEPDILVNNAAGPPPGSFEGWGEDEWRAATYANMIAPILLIRAVLSSMRRRGWGRILNITSSAVKAPLPLLGLSNGARSGLTGFVAGLAREVACDGVTINNLLPGTFATDRLSVYAAALASSRGIETSEAVRQIETANPTRRIGRPEEFGAVCAFMASCHAGYITGQNILLDGGAYPGAM
jgi:3-oxoacyl-[acyl-carrier protein] reductase